MQTEQGWHAPDCQPIVSRRSIRVRQIHKRVKTLRILVGATGFEPATPCAQGRCATRLRYAPTPQRLSHGTPLPAPKHCPATDLEAQRASNAHRRGRARCPRSAPGRPARPATGMGMSLAGAAQAPNAGNGRKRLRPRKQPDRAARSTRRPSTPTATRLRALAGRQSAGRRMR
jgi:hypothetical protein